MNNEANLRIVMQAIGVYCIIHSLLTAFQAMGRWLSWRYIYGMVSRDSVFGYLLESLTVSALTLAPAWVLLAKTDWCVRVVVQMSAPKPNGELVEDD